MRIDWTTLALQTVNVVVLLWLLRRFLFRPIVEIISARKLAAEQLLAQAAAARAQAEAASEAATRRQDLLAADSDRILAEARTAAESERAGILERAKNDMKQARDALNANLQRERERIRGELEMEARDLALSIAARLLRRVPAQAVTDALLQSVETWLADLSTDQLRAFAQPQEVLEVVTASPLDGAARAACTKMLSRRIGDMPKPRFSADPSLIAGVELRGTHVRLQNNWRADLDRIAQEVSRDAEQLAVA